MLLTWNEEANIAACLRSLAAQKQRDFEVIVIDAASTDATVSIVRQLRPTFPVPLRIEAAQKRLPIGEARNMGVLMSRADLVAFVSADAELEPHWTQEALRGLQTHDVVYGRQIHEPHHASIGAAVRGLRYHFPNTTPADPLPYASNVAAAYKKRVLQQFPFDPWANAAEDILLAKRAAQAGYRISYDPFLVVRHHDVATVRQEMRKNVREGQGWGEYRNELGIFHMMLAWGILLLGAVTVLAFRPLLGLLALLVLLWLPALRRALRHRRDTPVSTLVVGVLASPVFDLAFLINYVAALLSRPRATPPFPKHKPKETNG